MGSVSKTILDGIVTIDEVVERFKAKAIDISPRSLRDVRVRQRMGLPIVKFGGRLVGFREQDVRRALRREQLGQDR